jgi:arsenate reductase
MAVTEVVIWHNPHCSTSRKTLELLRDRGIAPIVRLYLEDAPDAEAIAAVLRAMDRPAGAILRWKEPLAAELGLQPDLPEQALIAAMATHPRLIERPVVIRGERAALGRPPEAVLALF